MTFTSRHNNDARHRAQWLWVALLLALAVGSEARSQVLPEPQVVKINERVYVLLGPIQHANRLNQGYMINSTVIVGSTGVILVDSGGTDEVGRHIAAAVRRITDKPVTHVVNTHHHGDHYLGNVAFHGATFISSENCRQMVLDTGREWVELMERDIGRRLPATKPVAAEVTYAEGTRTEAKSMTCGSYFGFPRGRTRWVIFLFTCRMTRCWSLAMYWSVTLSRRFRTDS